MQTLLLSVTPICRPSTYLAVNDHLSNPVLTFCPFSASYLGNQAFSYGQILSFSLRLDRGVRRPSVADVVLQGAGLKVAASLGDLRTVVPCAKKITYTFR